MLVAVFLYAYLLALGSTLSVKMAIW